MVNCCMFLEEFSGFNHFHNASFDNSNCERLLCGGKYWSTWMDGMSYLEK